MSFDLQRILRRLKPLKRVGPLSVRKNLPFVEAGAAAGRKLLYDTTVYVDIIQGHFPQHAEAALVASDAWHSPVAEAELVALCGMLDPKHPGTTRAIDEIGSLIARRSQHRVVPPDREVWVEAGILSGLVARLQGYGRSERLRILNDALLFASARKHGLTVLTRNTKDFDLLQQLEPGGMVAYYERQRQ